MSILCLTVCYLTLEVVVAFSSIIETNSQQTFNKYFDKASFIIASPRGIRFDKNGNLINTATLDSSVLNNFKGQFSDNDYRFIGTNSLNKKETNFIVIPNKALHTTLVAFCKNNNIKILNSFYLRDNDTIQNGLMYDVNGTGNRFTVFSFQNQISAFILGSELSSDVGYISRLVFLFSVVFTFYISLLYFQERKNEFSTLIIQGHTDENLKIIFIDCILQNVISFFLSLIALSIILSQLTKSSSDFQNALRGLFYILPYLPMLIIIQLLLFLNRALNYASNIE